MILSCLRTRFLYLNNLTDNSDFVWIYSVYTEGIYLYFMIYKCNLIQ